MWKRFHVRRAILGGLGGTLVAAAVAIGLAHVDAPTIAGAGDTALGWLALFVGGQIIAFAFALLWDELPPRTRPVSKAIVFCVVVFLSCRFPIRLWPAAIAFAFVLGLAYRPHPAPPVEPRVLAHP